MYIISEQKITYQTPKSTSGKGEYVACEWCRADHHYAETTAHSLAHLTEHQLIPQRVTANYASETF